MSWTAKESRRLWGCSAIGLYKQQPRLNKISLDQLLSEELSGSFFCGAVSASRTRGQCFVAAITVCGYGKLYNKILFSPQMLAMVGPSRGECVALPSGSFYCGSIDASLRQHEKLSKELLYKSATPRKGIGAM